MEIAKSAKYGFSKIQMDKKLQDLGYDSSRRKRIMNSMLGATNQEPRKPSLDELAKIERKEERGKRLRVYLGRISEREVEEYKRKKGGWYDKRQAPGFAGKGLSPEESRGFALGGKNNSLGINTKEPPRFRGINNS